MMSWKDKLSSFIEKKQKQVQHGCKITEQVKAEKLRKKQNRLKDAKPGAITAIRSGLVTHANPLDVMKEEYERRKYEREHR